jgi:LPS-assembly protein
MIRNLCFAPLSSYFCVLFSLGLFLICVAEVRAQIEPPDRRYIFLEDRQRKREERKKNRSNDQSEIQQRQRAIEQTVKSGQQPPFDIDATSLNASGSKVKADGGLTIKYLGSVVEAEKGEFDITTKDAQLSGDVRLGDATGSVTAQQADINVDSKLGQLKVAEVVFDESGYRIAAQTVDKKEQGLFLFDDASFTTCLCPNDNCVPWRLDADSAAVTQNGYGHLYGATFKVADVPVFYTPYLLFPAKSKRQTGFLTPKPGTSSESGFNLQLPFFWAIDRSTDVTITPLTETETRNGVITEARKIFSLDHTFEGGVTFLNESARGDELQGTSINGLDDPEIPTNRYAWYVDHNYKALIGEQHVQYLLHGRYVGDDLFLREFEQDRLGDYNDRFVTSDLVFRTTLLESFSLDVAGEYNFSLQKLRRERSSGRCSCHLV